MTAARILITITRPTTIPLTTTTPTTITRKTITPTITIIQMSDRNRSALTATTRTTRMLAHPMVITGRPTLLTAFLLGSVPGIRVITEAATTGVAEITE